MRWTVPILAIAIAGSTLLVWRWTTRRKPATSRDQTAAENNQTINPASDNHLGASPQMRPRRGGIARLLNRRTFFATVAAALAALAALAYAVAPSGNDNETPRAADLGSPSADASPASTAGATRTPTQPAAGSPPATEQPQGMEFVRLVAPALGIDAPVITLGVDVYGTMESPDNPTDVAWYNFSALPGEGSNVVMAGHLDFAGYGPAVFYNLKNARRGDEVHLVLSDGSIARYRVTGVTTYDEATAPVQEIVGPTDHEVITLITCGGSFDRLSREYDKRVVLRADRVDSAAVAN